MTKSTEHGKGECLSACDDQSNQVIVNSSMFLNHETFENEGFCATFIYSKASIEQASSLITIVTIVKQASSFDRDLRVI